MILSRVIEHVKHQNWTAVAIDFVIVVVGVFIGIQLGNWNEARSDARLGREYVNRLSRDLNEDLAHVRTEVAYYTDVLRSVEKTDVLLGEADPDPRALVINAYRASEVTYDAPVRATWDQIVSSGHLGLLPAAATDSRLSLYYAFNSVQDVYQVGLSSGYRRTVRSIIPIAMQSEMRARCSDMLNEWQDVVGFVEDCAFEADAAKLKEVAAALKSDPVVAADLRFQFSFASTAVGNLQATERILEGALAALGAAPPVPEKAAR